MFIVLFLVLVHCAEPELHLHRVPIHGNVSLGYYYIDMYVGTPPQKTSLVIDTGSGVQAIPCQPCGMCGRRHLNPPFKPTISSTSKQMTCENHSLKKCQGCDGNLVKSQDRKCTFQNHYAEGSFIKGYYLEDVVAITENPNQAEKEGVKATFGCINQQSHLFLTQQADGILGLSQNSQANFLEQIYKQHKNFTNERMQFGICLAINGGSFSVGNVDESLHAAGAQPIVINLKKPSQNFVSSFVGLSTPKFYTIDAQQIYVGTRSLQLSSNNFEGQGLFVDSGATYTYLPDRQYKILIEEMDEVCKTFECKIAKGQSSRCYHFNNQFVTLESQAERFPNITISLPNSKERLHWTPFHYFMLRNTKAREVCIGVQRLGRLILGSNWMTDRDIYFDLSDSRLLVYDSPSCGQTKNDEKKIRLMYESEKSALAETPFDNIKAQSQWLVVLFSILTGIIILALLLVVIVRCCEKKEEKAVEREMVEEEDDIVETQEQITSPKEAPE